MRLFLQWQKVLERTVISSWPNGQRSAIDRHSTINHPMRKQMLDNAAKLVKVSGLSRYSLCL